MKVPPTYLRIELYSQRSSNLKILNKIYLSSVAFEIKFIVWHTVGALRKLEHSRNCRTQFRKKSSNCKERMELFEVQFLIHRHLPSLYYLSEYSFCQKNCQVLETIWHHIITFHDTSIIWCISIYKKTCQNIVVNSRYV